MTRPEEEDRGLDARNLDPINLDPIDAPRCRPPTWLVRELSSDFELGTRDVEVAANVRGGPVVTWAQDCANGVQESTSASSFGTYNGHSPDRQHAVDIFVAAANYNSDPTLGNQVVAYLIANIDRFGIDYIIWRQRIFNPEIAPYWRTMTHTGDPTADHYDHVHVSFTYTGPIISPPAPEPPEEEDLTGEEANTLRFCAQVLTELKRPFEKAGNGDFFAGLEKFAELLEGWDNADHGAAFSGNYTVTGQLNLNLE